MSKSQSVEALGPSYFNINADYTESTFISYLQQIRHVTQLQPRTVLVIGVGDHLVSDFLKRKGFDVKTLDVDPDLKPDYLCDIRRPLPIGEKFDLVLACEVFEHFPFKDFEKSIENIVPVVGTHLVISMPYPTIRLFPPRPKYGRIISCEGRLFTYLPWQLYRDAFNFLRFLKRVWRYRFRIALAWHAAFKKPEWPSDKVDVHHWDLSQSGTGREQVKHILSRQLTFMDEKIYINTNCVFFILRRR